MRIKSVQLSWFRDAADPVSLDVGCKSKVVYGQNGSGKSSFVDAVEYAIRAGKIGHLAHEYSGRRQEKGIRNTHTPTDRQSEIGITFENGSELKVKIDPSGVHTRLGAESVAIDSWEFRRTVLRQDEVAEFIHETKGGKYSALLPLLGYHGLEVAAENLRKLTKSVERESKLSENESKLNDVENQRASVFGTVTDEELIDRINQLCVKYCPGQGRG